MHTLYINYMYTINAGLLKRCTQCCSMKWKQKNYDVAISKHIRTPYCKPDIEIVFIWSASVQYVKKGPVHKIY